MLAVQAIKELLYSDSYDNRNPHVFHIRHLYLHLPEVLQSPLIPIPRKLEGHAFNVRRIRQLPWPELRHVVGGEGG
jgi:hypothetical protein